MTNTNTLTAALQEALTAGYEIARFHDTTEEEMISDIINGVEEVEGEWVLTGNEIELIDGEGYRTGTKYILRSE